MGCSTSKLDDEEAVQLCKDRKRLIKEAVEQRSRFASGHIAYIQSLKRVSAALRDYIEGDEPREFLLDSFITPPVKKPSTGFITISSKTLSSTPIQSQPNPRLKINYLRPGGEPAVFVEERPQSPETVQVETYSPMHPYGIDGFFGTQSMSSSFFSYSPNNGPNIPPSSPQTSQWDFFWNPFSSLDYYGYHTRSNLDHTVMYDDIRGLRQVREEEGIPELEEETEQDESDYKVNLTDVRTKPDINFPREGIVEDIDVRTKPDINFPREGIVEDIDEDEDEDEDEDDEEEIDGETETEHQEAGLQSHRATMDVSKAQATGKVEINNQEMAIGDQESKEETPGFTVYVNRRPTSMTEVVKDLETQFMIVCNSANEVSALLEASRAHYASTNNELTPLKMLNPVALFRSASSRSSSSRFLVNSSSSREEGYESSSDYSEESCLCSGSHQSTLDRLHAWEKKLYDEVKSGEKVRIAYDKKRMQLRNQDIRGDDPNAVDKTRAAIRDLHTQIKVSIHSVEAISKRIEALRDEELQPQLLELAQGLARMWKVMAECHQSQKRTLDEAKLLLAGMPSKIDAKKHYYMSLTEPHRLARSAANLETELRNWRVCFESWITSQRSYVHALTGWLLRCVRSDSDTAKAPFSPRRSSGTLPIFGLGIQWSKIFNEIRETPVLDGLDFFAAGMGSLYAQRQKEDSRRTPSGSKRYGLEEFEGNMKMVEVGKVEEEGMTAEKMAEVAIRVLCAGMSVAMTSLTEFSINSAERYEELVKQWENTKRLHSSSGTEM